MPAASIRDTVSKGYLARHLGRVRSRRSACRRSASGTFMVFKTFDRMSYGLIMEATDIIQVLDHVEESLETRAAREALIFM